MTAEALHDALTLLPGELVAEADKRRCRKPLRIVWRRWAGMAACLVVILGCSFWIWISGMGMGSSKSSNQMMMAAPAACDQAAAEAAPQEPVLSEATPTEAGPGERKAAASGATTMDAGSLAPGVLNITWVETPGVSGSAANISGMTDVSLISDRRTLDAYLAGRIFENVDALRESTAGYDDGWFEACDLLLIRVQCPMGTCVVSIQEADGQWEIHLGESTQSLWSVYHILIDAEKGAIESADHVTIVCG